jgi:hypothetical protein
VLEHRCEEWGGPTQSSDGKSRPVADLARCYRPLTVDQLYDRCAEIIDRATSGVVLELHQSGILAACTLPNAPCGPSSSACVTLRWAWEPSEERPCVAALRAYPHGNKRKVLCNTCTCTNGGEGCTDAGPDMCLP